MKRLCTTAFHSVALFGGLGLLAAAALSGCTTAASPSVDLGAGPGSGLDGGVADLSAGAGSGDAALVPVPTDAGEGAHLASAIKHLVVIVQENHSFDNYFATYCTAPAGSNPSCTTGPACCEAGPGSDPGTGIPPVTLDDTTNAAFDPDHSQPCEVNKMNNGKMNQYVTASPLVTCGNPLNFAYAGGAVDQYRAWATAGALADRYFQPVIGASGSNLVYLATARFLFTDNAVEPQAIGAQCAINPGSTTALFSVPQIGDLLDAAGVSWTWYAEGYNAMKAAGTGCPAPAAGCPLAAPALNLNPCIYDPSTVFATYFRSTVDNPMVTRDLDQLSADLVAGNLPSVVFIRGLNFRTEHPGFGVNISTGVEFSRNIVNAINQSSVANSTLTLLLYDESGGYFDHVTPPPTSTVDNQPYGARVPMVAIGPFAKAGTVSHVVLEHSSLVKFIEWNWLGATGQLNARDAVVNNLGSLLNPATVGVAVPE